MIIAQIDQLPASAIKTLVIVAVSMLGIAGIAVGIYAALRKPTMAIDPQPVEVRKAPKRFNHELAEERHGEVVRRLDGHDEDIAQLRAEMKLLESKLDAKVSKIHSRVNRILAGQMLIAGQMGVALDQPRLSDKMQQLETEEEL